MRVTPVECRPELPVFDEARETVARLQVVENDRDREGEVIVHSRWFPIGREIARHRFWFDRQRSKAFHHPIGFLGDVYLRTVRWEGHPVVNNHTLDSRPNVHSLYHGVVHEVFVRARVASTRIPPKGPLRDEGEQG